MYADSVHKNKVFVNGTFDILHPGHINLLRAAKSLGRFLLVAIDSDERVLKLKGKLPRIPQNDRKYMLENISSVNQVEIFSSDQELRELIFSYSPYYMVKGSDYLNKSVIGEGLVPEIRYVSNNDYSSSKL